MTAVNTSAPSMTTLTQMIGDLRQTWPFRYLDQITSIGHDLRSMKGELCLAHPDRYIPETTEPILLEALAQLSGLMVRVYSGHKVGGVLAMVEHASWHGAPELSRPVELSVTLIGEAFPIFTMRGEVSQDGQLLCTSQFSTRSNAGDTK